MQNTNNTSSHFTGQEGIAILRSALLAGLCISIGCVVNLRVGGVAGAVLFAFGLLAVVHYKLKLYTGTAGFIRYKGDWTMLCLVLLGNIIACGLTSLACSYVQPDILPPDLAIVQSRLAKGPFACLLLAIGCGFTSAAIRSLPARSSSSRCGTSRSTSCWAHSADSARCISSR